jgi:hypothetical protein
MHQMDWDAEAAAMAQYVHDELMSAHGGAMPWRQPGISAVLGNDGYGSPKVQAEVASVRARLAGFGVKILGFGLNPSGEQSWAMLAETDGVKLLTAFVWEAWEDGYSDPTSESPRPRSPGPGLAWIFLPTGSLGCKRAGINNLQ